MKLAVPDLISNSYFPAVAAVALGFFEKEGLDVSLELIFPVDKCYEAMREGAVDFVGGSAHRLALHRIAADDLVDTEPRLQVAGVLENGCGKNRAFAGSIFPLAVEPERRIQPRQMAAILRE